jgi:hypothetical protein
MLSSPSKKMFLISFLLTKESKIWAKGYYIISKNYIGPIMPKSKLNCFKIIKNV